MSQTRRTYIYYSDDKVLEYKQQAPPTRWRRAIERLKGVEEVEVKVLGSGAKVGTGPRASEPVLRTMQEMWVDLTDEGLVGSFDEPREYFYGKLLFYYGFFSVVDPPVFFLVGATDQTLVALGGSQKHVRGFRGREIPVADDAQAVVMEPDVASLLLKASTVDSLRSSTEFPPSAPTDDPRAVHVAMLYRNRQFWQGRKMKYEVLARKELESSLSSPSMESPTNVLIGTPVFVAQT